jgi:hypothetical protein
MHRVSSGSSKTLLAISLSDVDEASLAQSRPLASPEMKVKMDKELDEPQVHRVPSKVAHVETIDLETLPSPEGIPEPLSPGAHSEVSSARVRRLSKLGTLEYMATKARASQTGIFIDEKTHQEKELKALGEKDKAVASVPPETAVDQFVEQKVNKQTEQKLDNISAGPTVGTTGAMSPPPERLSEELPQLRKAQTLHPPEKISEEPSQLAKEHASSPYASGNAMAAISRLRSARAALWQSTLVKATSDSESPS